MNKYKIIQTIIGGIFFIIMFLAFTGEIEAGPFVIFVVPIPFIGAWLVLEHLSSKEKKKKHPEKYEETEGSFWKSPDGGISAKGLGALILAVIIIAMIFVFISSLT